MIVIVDYNMGNVRSIAKALESLGVKVLISNKKEDIKKADRLILSGVGAFADGMKNLKKLGLINFLNQEVIKNKKLILGICLGMQLMAKDSAEFGLHKGLGWLDASVKEFNLKNKNLKIPHVGWNNVRIIDKKCSLLKGIKSGTDFYFVHSYHLICRLKNTVKAVCCYGDDFTAVIQKDNIFGTQFHPEKSQKFGLEILKNFINLK
ncbi:imidazole glycerol phosphate synthase subunit HisH [Candidatus Falkowbacteria bacterium]|nr:imidazole glycerol phosphate synthase subunit HisH [Candidatus Falkowbacteria bacterium]